MIKSTATHRRLSPTARVTSIIHCARLGALGGWSASPLAYATRQPGHPGKLILVSTEAAGHSHPERCVALFERLGRPEAGALAALHADRCVASRDGMRKLRLTLINKPIDFKRSVDAPRSC